MAKNICKKTSKECEGRFLREYFHSLPYCEIRIMRKKIAEATGVKQKTVVQWSMPGTYRKHFTDLQKRAIEATAGKKIF
ncbi:MAG: hypothetical protein NC311_13165 [Muribaculaceae bacterium]|nr:hypothetical protein [Muribaculaceae bacterium]